MADKAITAKEEIESFRVLNAQQADTIDAQREQIQELRDVIAQRNQQIREMAPLLARLANYQVTHIEQLSANGHTHG